MRHRVKGRKLGRTASHRTATLRSLATALIKHKKITTTVAKAKQMRLFVEPLITKAKDDSVHARRLVARHINDKDIIKELFTEVVKKIGDRPGGYTRIVKLGNRLGDAAEMAIIELVDYNDINSNKSKTSKKKAEPKAKTKVETKQVPANIEKVTEEVIEDKVEEKSSDADDLTKIEGIGPKISELLVDAGITTFAKLAETEVVKLREILYDAGSKFKSHDPETWPTQSQLAADGRWDELKKLQDELIGGKAK
ncbi:MAG: 50S ribosomal protein L17 [Ignavibacteriae bacterium]|nr:50S ribosomal protein L17 [Ignavibacteriota bacterium]